MDRLRVLVIDDSLTIRAMVEQLIEKEAGCRVVGVASDVPTARRMMIELMPNVVTLDLAMPGIDGIQFLDELRGQMHAPVIVVSSSTNEGAEATKVALDHGAAACFDKTRIVCESSRLIKLLKNVAKAGQKKGATCLSANSDVGY